VAGSASQQVLCAVGKRGSRRTRGFGPSGPGPPARAAPAASATALPHRPVRARGGSARRVRRARGEERAGTAGTRAHRRPRPSTSSALGPSSTWSKTGCLRERATAAAASAARQRRPAARQGPGPCASSDSCQRPAPPAPEGRGQLRSPCQASAGTRSAAVPQVPERTAGPGRVSPPCSAAFW
jgi:hypothetical protein